MGSGGHPTPLPAQPNLSRHMGLQHAPRCSIYSTGCLLRSIERQHSTTVRPHIVPTSNPPAPFDPAHGQPSGCMDKRSPRCPHPTLQPAPPPSRLSFLYAIPKIRRGTTVLVVILSHKGALRHGTR